MGFVSLQFNVTLQCMARMTCFWVSNKKQMYLKLGAMLVSAMVLKLHIKPTIR
jgi:hypothetical protein